MKPDVRYSQRESPQFQENALNTLTNAQIHFLQHMLGARPDQKKSQHGYRNRFCAGVDGQDYVTGIELRDMGLVSKGYAINEGRDWMFFATEKGCQAIGLSKAATKRAMED